MLVTERIAHSLRQRPNERALEFRGRWYDWRALAEAADAICQPFEALGLPAGAPVALVARNRPGHVAALLGLLARGWRVQMVYAFQPAAQLARELRGMEAVGVVYDRDDTDLVVLDALRDSGMVGVAVDGLLDELPQLAPSQLALRPASLDTDIAIEMLTSGTTGTPKRVSIRHDTLHKATVDLVRAGDGGVTAPDILSFPIGNVSGLYYLVPACANHSPLALLEKFKLDDWLAALQMHRPAYCALPPAAIRMILDAQVPKDALRSLSAVGVGAARLDPEVQAEFEERYGLPIIIGYGATEFCGVVATWTLDDHRQFAKAKRGSVGRARPGVQLRIVDADSGAPLLTGDVGVIEAQVERIGPSFVRTTDLGSLDADGFLFLHGRADDTINRGGHKVQPQKVEALLREHPAIADAAVVARQDERLGEVPVAVYELRPGAQAPEASQLAALLRERLRPPEVPAHYLAVDALPRTPSMKVRRADVRAIANGPLPGSQASS